MPETVEMFVERDLIVTARDGVGLASPTGDGRFPVLMERAPYDKSAPSRSERTTAVGGRWWTARDWPLPQTVWTKFYLRSDRSLGHEFPDDGAGSLGYASDPRDPVPTIGGALSLGEPVMRGGAYNQRDLAERADVLAFATLRSSATGGDPTCDDSVLDLFRRPRHGFYGKADRPAPPNEDYPNGFAMNLTEGILRCRYRDSWERPSPLVPGEVFAITIELFPTGNLFTRGHRLRLDIASTNFPHFDINPNSGEPEGAMEHPRAAHNRVFVDAAHPSHIVLPVILAGS
jgi:putative CocE/NonD family hydrolase